MNVDVDAETKTECEGRRSRKMRKMERDDPEPRRGMNKDRRKTLLYDEHPTPQPANRNDE